LQNCPDLCRGFFVVKYIYSSIIITMKHSTLVALSLLFVNSLLAQIPVAWAQRYNAPPDNADEARSIALDGSGNVYVTGSAFNSSGNLDMVTVKYSATGQFQWVQNYDRGNDNDEAFKLIVDASGNVYVTGYSKGNNGPDITTIKYDTQGSVQWVAHHNGAGNSLDQGNAIALDASNNVIVCGYETTSNFTTDLVIIKYDNNGTQLWNVVYNGQASGEDVANDLTTDSQGNVYVVGSVQNATNNSDYAIFKYNSAGSQQWLQFYNGPSNDNDFGKAITLDASSNILVTGYSFQTNNWFDFLTLKYTTAGVLNWTARYNNAANRYEEANDIVTDPSGNVYVTGQSQAIGNNSTPADYATVKYDATGTQLWISRYDGGVNADDRAYAIALDDSLNVYVTGYSIANTTSDYVTIKYNNQGNMIWNMRYDGPAGNSDQAAAMAVNSTNGDVYITGKSANNTNDDFLTIKYSYAAVGIEDVYSANAFEMYPNPNNGEFFIDISTKSQEDVVIEVLNSIGQVVFSNRFSSADRIELNLNTLPSGVYFARVLNGNNSPLGLNKLIIK